MSDRSTGPIGLLRGLRLMEAAGKDRHGMRLLDVCYGPLVRKLRAQVVEAVCGHPVPASGKDAQWGNFRKLLLERTGATGNCIANEDANFEEVARAILADNLEPAKATGKYDENSGPTPY